MDAPVRGCDRARAARRRPTNCDDLRGLLTPGRSSTPLDTSTPKGRTARIAAATLAALEPAREDRAACGAPAAAPRSSRPPARVPLAGPSNRRRGGSGSAGCAAGAHHRQHSQRSGSRSAPRSSTSVCSTSGLNTRSISSSARCCGWRVTATQRNRAARRRASCAAASRRQLARRRREHEAEARPRRLSAASTASASSCRRS